MAEPRDMRGRALVLVLVLCIALAAAGFGTYRWLEDAYSGAGPLSAPLRIRVEPGTSVRVVLARLESGGALRSARAVAWYLRLKGIPARVQAGDYEIPPHASAAQMLELFAQGKVVLEELTVVEGATFADFLQALEQHPHVVHTLTGRTPPQIMASLGHPTEAAEGEFFPDTYRFADGTSDVAILALAYDSMQRALGSAWQARSSDLPLDTPYQALILASMVRRKPRSRGSAPASRGYS